MANNGLGPDLFRLLVGLAAANCTLLDVSRLNYQI
jgi:hypothetical protein